MSWRHVTSKSYVYPFLNSNYDTDISLIQLKMNTRWFFVCTPVIKPSWVLIKPRRFKKYRRKINFNFFNSFQFQLSKRYDQMEINYISSFRFSFLSAFRACCFCVSSKAFPEFFLLSSYSCNIVPYNFDLCCDMIVLHFVIQDPNFFWPIADV